MRPLFVGVRGAYGRRMKALPLETPLRFLPLNGWRIALKLEGAFGGSHKDRAARAVLKRLFRDGKIPGTRGEPRVLVISSSGNAAYALAVQSVGLDVVLVVFTDTLSPTEMADRLRQFSHVRVIVINEPDATGSHAKARAKAVEKFLAENPTAIVIDQYFNSEWPVGYGSLVREIEAQVGGRVGVIVVPVGTCALLHSLARFRRRHGRRWKLIAVDAVGSAIFTTPRGRRLFSGYGNGAKTEWARQAEGDLDEVVRVDDESAVRASRFLTQRHRLKLGASSCAAFAATSWLIAHDRLPHDGMPVLIMPDGGTNYGTTLYNDQWIAANGLGHAISATES